MPSLRFRRTDHNPVRRISTREILIHGQYHKFFFLLVPDLVIIGLAEGVKYKGRFGSVFEWEPACYDNKNEV
ncbi:unnamed protein product [Brassica oleracea var. botrytis]